MEYQNSLNFLGEKQSGTLSNPLQSTSKGHTLTGGSIFTQSATSLTRGVILWSFPKAKRFKDVETITKNVPMRNLGSTLSRTATSLGFGKRYDFHPVDTPAPSLSHRNLPSIKNQNLGVTTRDNFNRESWDTHKEIPGPGSYEIERGFLKKNKGVCLKSRGNVLDPVKENPGPNYYSPNTNFTERNRYSSIAFGTSKRYDFTKSGVQKFPGPGTYDIVSGIEKKNNEIKIKDMAKKQIINIEKT